MIIDIQSLFQECEDTISQISSQLEQILTQEQKQIELEELLKLKKQFLERIKELVKREGEGIAQITSHFDGKGAQFLEHFKQDLDIFLQALSQLNSNSIQAQLQFLKTEYEIFTKNEVELQRLIELRKKAQNEPDKQFEDEEHKVFKIMQEKFKDLPDLPDDIKNTVFSQQGVYLFTLLYEMSESDATYKNILKFNLGTEILRLEMVHKLQQENLLQIIEQLIILRKNCQNDETYSNILEYVFYRGILCDNSALQLKPQQLLKIIQQFGEEFINLRNKCESDKTYGFILESAFTRGIFFDSITLKLQLWQLLNVIKQFIKLRNYSKNDEIYESILIHGFSCPIDDDNNEILQFGFSERIFENENIKKLSAEELIQLIDTIISVASTSTNNTPQRIMAIFTLLLYDIEPEELSDYFKNHIKDSKDKSSLLQQLPKNPNTILKKIVHYIIKYQPKQLVKVAKEISLIQQLNLNTTIRFLEVNLTPLTEMNVEQLQIALSRNNQTQEINIVTFYNNYCNPTTRELQKFGNILNQINLNSPRELYYGELVSLTQMIYEKVFINLKQLINSQIESKFKEEFNFENFDNSLCDELFMEVYKMYSSDRLTHDKEQIRELLINYLNKNCYPQNTKVLKSYPYSHPNNQKWISSFFGDSFLNTLKARRWFNENRQEFKILESMDSASKESELNKYLQEIQNILIRNTISSIQISTYEQAKIYFEPIKQKEIKKLFSDENEYVDLILQVNNIKKLYEELTNTKKLTKISIYHEINPLSIALMGNRVDGSCLSFYSGVNNYYSAFSNALDANKFVFYITDERGGIIARVLCAINKSKELVRFRMYSKGNIHVTYNLDFYFNKYIQNLCRKYGITISNMDSDENDFENLVCEEWYWENNYIEN